MKKSVFTFGPGKCTAFLDMGTGTMTLYFVPSKVTAGTKLQRQYTAYYVGSDRKVDDITVVDSSGASIR
jgi:hypothetical protein